MRHRTTVVLFTLFLAGLGVLWWADYADVPTRDEQRVRLNRLLPELVDTPVGEVRRIEVVRDGGKERLVVERRAGGTWQMLSPADGAADAGLIETLTKNLKELRKSADAGTITGDPAPYGLATPKASVRLYGTDPDRPLASLEVGARDRDRLYVRPGDSRGIEVVDARLLLALEEDIMAWRDRSLFHVPSFRVEGVTIAERDPTKTIALRRDARRWRLDSPVKTPADDDKAEGVVAELTGLHVTEGNDGFVEDGVRDRAKYGLAEPAMTLTLSPFAAGKEAAKPQTVYLGKAVPGKENQVYAVRADQDDVVRVDVKTLREAVPGPNGLRSPRVFDFTPQRVTRLRVERRDEVIDLARTAAGWEMLAPVNAPADAAAVESLLVRLNDLRASAFLQPGSVADPRLDRPRFRVRGWQAEPGARASEAASASTEVPAGEPRFDLSLGRVDVVKKTVYGRLPGDPTVLAIPDAILAELPRNAFAYRDRTVLKLTPTQFARLTVERRGSSATVEASGAKGRAGVWRMTAPVDARADSAAVTSILVVLSNLRAESWESDKVGDAHGKAFGLDAPRLRVKWTLQERAGAAKGSTAETVLRIGSAKKETTLFYANIEGDPRVFTLAAGVVAPMEFELHYQAVLGFKPENADGLTLRWPTRTLALERVPQPGGLGALWQPVPGYDPSGLESLRADELVKTLAGLKTPRFLQYAGAIAETFGLDEPRATIEVRLAEGKGSSRAGRTLRVGNSAGPGAFAATNAEGDEGPVFLLPLDPALRDLFRAPPRPGDLPDEVFVAEPPAAQPPG